MNHNPYDEVMYDNCALLHTYPNRLAILGKLFGMTPAPVESCRVLELGCGDGANLIPMAYGLPKSEFSGIDLAGRPIAKGQAMIRELGLKNINLQQMDILDFPDDSGQFDYIISYGLYSWVPAEVRDKILAISKAHLAPQGIAFVSYNTYPGWHLRQMVREMMQYHIQPDSSPQEQMIQAKALVQFLADSGQGEGGYEHFLREEWHQVLKRTGTTLFHDDLSPINHAVYFCQFAEEAAKHGLQYLAETDFFVSREVSASPEMVKTLSQLDDDLVRREQYLDFLRCRRFRQTLLCHEGGALNRELNLDCLRDFQFLCFAQLASEQSDLAPGVALEFRGPRGASMKTAHPLAKAALLHLSGSWPRALSFQEIWSEARDRVAQAGRAPASGESDAQELGQVLLTAYGVGLLEARTQLPSLVLEVSDRPVASPLARLQLRTGDMATSLLHTTVGIHDLLAKNLLLLLDGTRDRDQLINELSQLVKSGVAPLQHNGKVVSEREQVRRALAEQLEQALLNIARVPLLVG